jgi:glutamine amidotransferase
MKKICILDYGVGNIRSIFNALKILEIDCVFSSEKKNILDCSHLILPGVGSYSSAISKLTKKINLNLLENQVKKICKPVLGICVGMQIFSTYGNEFGRHKGLNWIKGEVKKIKTKNILPHIGWNNVKILKKNLLLKDENEEFYFSHSYSFRCNNNESVFGETKYGSKIQSIIIKDNIYGVQFHPEKSQISGLKILKNFFQIK